MEILDGYVVKDDDDDARETTDEVRIAFTVEYDDEYEYDDDDAYEEV